VIDPFLIDECLSLDLVALAQARGHHATHVAFRGLQGTSDRGLLPIIREEGFVLVTNNARDFLRLYGQETVHPGLIVLVPGGIRAEFQARLFGLALDVIEPMTDLVNKVVEVGLSGMVTLRDWPVT
jgi:predicted nuclease of predicted toxin-antitoxin system